MKKNIYDMIIRISTIILILFGLYIIYQLMKAVFGGSWSIEGFVVALLIFNIAMTFNIGTNLTKLRSDHNHLSNQFKSLAYDFKKHIKEHA